MNHAAINAFYNCGLGRIDYTRGVLDALGHAALSAEIGFATQELEQARTEDPVDTCSTIEEALSSPPRSEAFHKASARMAAAFRAVEALADEYREGQE